MAEQLIQFKGIKGLMPALDRKQIETFHVVDGANFVFDAEGPLSAFGSSLIGRDTLAEVKGAESFRVEGELIVFNDEGVFGFDTLTKMFFPLYLFPSLLVDKFPWSTAQIAGIYYFGRKGLGGVLTYDPVEGNWFIATENYPDNPHAVAQALGRLVVLGEIVVAWSEIDDGSSAGMLPSTTTGAGFQLLVIVGSGAPLGVFATPDGFITYTKTGIMKSEFIDSANPFRHYSLSQKVARANEILPINPFSILEIGGNRHIYLSRKGFLTTIGGPPEPWQPLFGEFVARKILPQYNLTNELLIRLSFDPDRQWFFVSISEGESEIYTKAYVLYVPRDEWGSFNRAHVALGEFNLGADPEAGLNFGYICNNCRTHYFTDNPLVETSQVIESGDYYYTVPFEYPGRRQGSAFKMPSSVFVRTIDESIFPPTTGVYSIELGTDEVTGNPAEYATLASWIDVGIARLSDQVNTDQLIEIVNVSVGMRETTETEIEEEDWLTYPDTNEDWLVDVLENEDWGFEIVSTTVYTIQIYGTLDGYEQFEDNRFTLEEYFSSGKLRFFPSHCLGMYHILHFDATEVRQSYHLKFLEAKAILAGQL